MRCVIAVLAVVSICELATAAADAKKLSNDTWSVSNDFVQRKISFSRENGLKTESLHYKVTGHDFVSTGRRANSMAGEFSFSSDGHELTGKSSFTLRGSDISSGGGGRLLRIDLRTLMLMSMFRSSTSRMTSILQYANGSL